jgi:hypothetical protein
MFEEEGCIVHETMDAIFSHRGKSLPMYGSVTHPGFIQDASADQPRHDLSLLPNTYPKPPTGYP